MKSESAASVALSTSGQLHEAKSDIEFIQQSHVEYLQREIARLLLKSETIRFELYAVRKKIIRIDRALFGDGSQDLRRQIPEHLLCLLCDLCGPAGTARASAKSSGRADGELPDWVAHAQRERDAINESSRAKEK